MRISTEEAVSLCSKWKDDGLIIRLSFWSDSAELMFSGFIVETQGTSIRIDNPGPGTLVLHLNAFEDIYYGDDREDDASLTVRIDSGLHLSSPDRRLIIYGVKAE